MRQIQGNRVGLRFETKKKKLGRKEKENQSFYISKKCDYYHFYT